MMTIEAMHYDFKKKLNKVDSQQYKNLLIPEIDWVLNEAYQIFVKMVAFPRYRKQLGFEKSQRNIDDIRPLVVSEYEDGNCITSLPNNIATLPSDYWFYISSHVYMSKGTCTEVKGKVNIREHDDESELSPFDKSSFEWREVDAVFFENGVKFLNENEFSIDRFCMSYIREPEYIHNAAGYGPSGYNLPGGQSLTGTQDCVLSESACREIVDLAVMITKGELENVPSYQLNQAKLKLNDLNA